MADEETQDTYPNQGRDSGYVAPVGEDLVNKIAILMAQMETKLLTSTAAITQRLDNRDRFDLDRRTEESTRRQAQEDYLYAELDKLGDGQGRLMAVSEATAEEVKKVVEQVGDHGRVLAAVLDRQDVFEETQRDHGEQLAAQAALIGAHTEELTHIKLRLTSVEAEQVALRSVMAHLRRDVDVLKRLREEPDGGK